MTVLHHLLRSRTARKLAFVLAALAMLVQTAGTALSTSHMLRASQGLGDAGVVLCSVAGMVQMQADGTLAPVTDDQAGGQGNGENGMFSLCPYCMAASTTALPAIPAQPDAGAPLAPALRMAPQTTETVWPRHQAWWTPPRGAPPHALLQA